MSDNSFGATTSKLIEVGLQYRICRTAAGVVDLPDGGSKSIPQPEGQE